MAAPTLAATPYNVNSTSATTAALTSPSFTPAVGEVIVVNSVTEDSGKTYSGPPTSSAGGLTFTQRVADTTSSHCGVYIWTSAVGAGQNVAMTISTGTLSTTGQHSMVVERWTGAQLAATPATANTRGSGAPSATVTTAAASSVVSWVDGDWNAVKATPAYLSSATQDGIHQVNNIYCAYYAYQQAPTAGAQTFGMTAPTGQAWTLAGIEIQAASSGSTTYSGGSAATATASASGGGKKVAKGGASGSSAGSAQGGGFKRISAGSTGSAAASVSGAGAKVARGGADATATASTTGGGHAVSVISGGSAATATASAAGGGHKVALGGIIASTTASSTGGGHKVAAGGSSATATATATGGGSVVAPGQGGSAAVATASATGSGFKVVRGGSGGSAVASANGTGYSIRRGGAGASATASATGAGKNPDLIVPPPADRTTLVRAESRTTRIAAESRVTTVPAERRVTEIR